MICVRNSVKKIVSTAHSTLLDSKELEVFMIEPLYFIHISSWLFKYAHNLTEASETTFCFSENLCFNWLPSLQ